MIELNGTTIIIPKGDTGLLSFEIEVDTTNGGTPINEETDRCIFGLYKDGQEILETRKILPIVDGIATVNFENEDTDQLEAGDYNWNLRIVIGPIWDDDNIDIVDGIEVHSPLVKLLKGKLPKLKLQEVGVNV